MLQIKGLNGKIDADRESVTSTFPILTKSTLVEVNMAKAKPTKSNSTIKICSVDTCSTRARCRGWCDMHYSRWAKYGDVETVLQPRGRAEADRFFAFVKKTATCWLWTGSLMGTGYGQFPNKLIRGKSAHRYSYALHFGTLPAHLFVCHRCDVPTCVNPDHLFLGTPKDNFADMQAKGRQRPGVNLGEKNGKSKLNASLVRLIRQDNRPCPAIAKELGLGRSTVLDVKTYVTWRHVK